MKVKSVMSKDYNDISHLQKWAIIKHMQDHWEVIAQKIEKSVAAHDSSLPYVIADFGCAGVANSLPYIDSVIAEVTKLSPAMSFVILFADLPDNDFTLSSKIANEHFKEKKHVFPMLIGKSFYEQNVPDEGIDFAFSFISVHWLSKVPGPLHGQIFGYAPIKDAEERKAWEEVAHDDLVTFLTMRKKELRAGGVLVVSVMNQDRLIPNLELIYNAF